MNQNSLDALRAASEKLSLRERVILGRLIEHGCMTDRDIKDALGFPDMNMVRPRVNELIKAGLVEKVRDTRCPVTGVSVRVVRAARVQVQQEEIGV